MKTADFFDIKVPEITYEKTVLKYDQLNDAWEAANGLEDYVKVIKDWDAVSRDIETWNSLIDLHFSQETNNPEYQRMREYSDELRPRLTELEVQLKRKFVKSNKRNELEHEFGKQAFALWENDIAAFGELIKENLTQEAKLTAEYVNLLASAQVPFQGQEFNFSQLAKYRNDSDRSVRLEANQAQWGWIASNKEKLDTIYDNQVRLRTQTARKLGYKDFTELAYIRMNRVDYTQTDVENFRAAIRKYVVPISGALRKNQAKRLEVDKVMYWDENVFDSAGNPKPMGGHDWMLERASEMFTSMDSRMSDAFQVISGGNFLDLKSRKGKAGGGFCTYFPSHGMPYIFANFNGTKSDVEVFSHEFGHAFQSYSSRNKSLSAYFFPTYESCEIHSMSLEFLTWPHMEKFFGDDAERFRHIHLMQSLLFLPYGVAVDHFQHLVYANPDATPNERRVMWQEMEQLYLPWRDASELPHVSEGGQWQLQQHIYAQPFYYIDYALALTCALQFWAQSQQDYASTINAYIALCERGGEVSFQQLVQSAGLISPFKDKCLSNVVEQAQNFLSIK